MEEMGLRRIPRRVEPDDLETARQMVSRAERAALDRAEELRQQAEELLKAASASPPSDLAAEADRVFQEAATAAEERFAKIQSELEEARSSADVLLREARTEVHRLIEAATLAAAPAAPPPPAPAPVDPGLGEELSALRSTMDSLCETLERFMFTQGGDRRHATALRGTRPLTGQAQ